MSTSSIPDLTGKIILVTGATEGIGKAAARVFARQKATLVVVGRNPEKTKQLVADLIRESGNARIESIVGDLSRLEEVRAVAAAFRSRHDRLDVLVNNAGGVFAHRTVTPDGFEQTFALNHLNYFLLTHELLDVLAKTPGARVVSTASGAHRQSRLDDLEEAAHRARGYSSWQAYSDSKLANILFTQVLARRVRDRGIVASCFHPGFVRTGFGQNNSGTLLKQTIGLGMALIARTPEKGAETLVWLATSPEAANASGGYFHDRRPSRIVRTLPMWLAVLVVLVGSHLGGTLAHALHLPRAFGGFPAGVGLAGLIMFGIRRSGLDALGERLWSFSERACGLATDEAPR